MQLDHIMYACRDLDEGIAEISALTGVSATPGGSHPGGGTRNALLSLGDAQYLEIIAPDPAQNLAGTMGEELSGYKDSHIRRWAVATADFARVEAVLEQFGVPFHVMDMDRTTPEGVHLAWRLLLPQSPQLEKTLPFFIDWQGSPHPAGNSPTGVTLNKFSIQIRERAGDLRRILEALELEAEVSEGPDSMRAVLETPNGIIMLH